MWCCRRAENKDKRICAYCFAICRPAQSTNDCSDTSLNNCPPDSYFYAQAFSGSNLNISQKKQNRWALPICLFLVRIRGFEPPRRQPTHGPEPCASANSAISAHWLCVVHATVLIYIICVTNASIIFTFLKKVWARHKPGSVLDDHLSRLTVTDKLQPSTSRTATGHRFLRPI